MSDDSIKGYSWGVLWGLQFIWFVCFFMDWNWPAGPIVEQESVLAISITTIEVVLAVLAIVLALGAIFSYTTFRRDIQLTATETAMEEARKTIERQLSTNGAQMIRDCLSDAEMVAQLQLKFREYGLEDAEEASEVDSDSAWEPETDE
ncbi:hypothetical protein [Ruegeria arenilitoris]|uniref:hypothetical protein n=1 Tax=Ruegeria arenilitoris TaxID=1173585 RepID=UPI00147A9B24|nr:hypothetical protein [Ruegeria arenilitoris]